MDVDKIETRLLAIELSIKALTKVLVEDNITAPTPSIASLAAKIANGDKTALQNHNRSRRQGNRGRWQ